MTVDEELRRIEAILALPEAVGREAAVLELLEAGTDVAAARDILASLPKREPVETCEQIKIMREFIEKEEARGKAK